jgi:hypothetical protein
MKRVLEGLIWYLVSIALIVYNLILCIKTNVMMGIILMSVMLGVVVLFLMPMEILRRIKKEKI